MGSPRNENRLGRIAALLAAATRLVAAVAGVLRALGKIL